MSGLPTSSPAKPSRGLIVLDTILKLLVIGALVGILGVMVSINNELKRFNEFGIELPGTSRSPVHVVLGNNSIPVTVGTETITSTGQRMAFPVFVSA